METKQRDPSQFQALELLVYFVCAWVVGLVFQRFSGQSFLGEYPWAGASVLLVIAALPTSFSAATPLQKCARFAVPAGLLTLFAVRGAAGDGIVSGLQQQMGALHFVFLFLASVFAVIFTQGAQAQKPVQRQQQVQRAMQSPAERPSVTRAKPDKNAFDRLVGQPHAVKQLKEIASMVRSGIRVGKRNAPHAVLLFLGPTGVGKTEAARALAQAVYGREDALIRFDMGQFTDSHQANRFYGPPPGYIGSEEGGQLTNAVLRKPHCVVLLDEVEKAHAQIWDAFLPVFDEGYIVDGSTNKKVDMTNTIIVLTSNLLVGVEGVTQKSSAELKEMVQQTGQFRPELVGRINEALAFNPLDPDSIREILRRRVDQSLFSLSEQGIAIFVDDDDIETMLASVQEAKFGVRQIDDVVRTYLRRIISEQQGPPLDQD